MHACIGRLYLYVDSIGRYMERMGISGLRGQWLRDGFDQIAAESQVSLKG